MISHTSNQDISAKFQTICSTSYSTSLLDCLIDTLNSTCPKMNSYVPQQLASPADLPISVNGDSTIPVSQSQKSWSQFDTFLTPHIFLGFLEVLCPESDHLSPSILLPPGSKPPWTTIFDFDYCKVGLLVAILAFPWPLCEPVKLKSAHIMSAHALQWLSVPQKTSQCLMGPDLC